LLVRVAPDPDLYSAIAKGVRDAGLGKEGIHVTHARLIYRDAGSTYRHDFNDRVRWCIEERKFHPVAFTFWLDFRRVTPVIGDNAVYCDKYFEKQKELAESTLEDKSVTTLATLKAARALIADEATWVITDFVLPIISQPEVHFALDCLLNKDGESLEPLGYIYTHTHAEVLALFDRAIAMEEEKNGN
jgi:hypothetical protein